MPQKRKLIKSPLGSKVKPLIILPVILTILGLFFIFEASSISAYREYGDSFFFLKRQLIWAAIGVITMFAFAFSNYRRLATMALPIFVVALSFLVLVLIPGIGTAVSGARRWIDLGIISFQPTEFAKLAVILYLSSWMLHKQKQRFITFLLLMGFIITLTMIQPDMGTAIIIFSLFVLIHFLAGEPVKHLLSLLPLAGVAFLILIKTSPYRMRRFLSFLDPNVDTLGISYHITQILISLSSGGLFGRGFAGSRQKYQFLPEAETDSIFAIIGEEVGFLGSVLVIGCYLGLIYYLYKTAVSTSDRFGFLLVSATFVLLSIQVLINLGGMVAIIPLTGVPLPFISYGGSSLLVFFALMGIVISVARR